MKKPELILFPSPGAGHRISACEFAHRFLNRNDRFTITILLIRTPYDDLRSIDIKTTTSAPSSSLRYVILPQVELPPAELIMKNPEKYHTAFIDSHEPHVRDVIVNLLNSGAQLAGLVVDMFCSSMIDVANKLGIPSYVFFTSGAAFLSLMFHLPACHFQFSESDNEDSIIPGFKNPIPAPIMPPFLFRESGFVTFAKHARCFRETKGIIVNTFAELEPYAVNSLQLDNQNPPIYTVGPVLDLGREAHGSPPREQHERITRWLDAQPESSVIFLCFGSLGTMCEAQVKEVALGLVQSGVRFLWCIRKPPTEDGQSRRPQDDIDHDLKETMPREFVLALEEGRGMVCGWAPQMEVLAHSAIAGFVSHCGWNSILESMWFGRPIVTWPMYAEQQSNAFQLVRDMGLAVEMRLAYRVDKGDIVTADELGRALECLMDEDNQVTNRVKEMCEMSRRALMEGGSSFESLGCLIDDILKNFSITKLL